MNLEGNQILAGVFFGLMFFFVVFLPTFFAVRRKAVEGVLKYAWRKDPFLTEEPMTLGTYHRDGWGDYWDGGLFDVRMYKEAVSPAKMRHLVSAEAASPGVVADENLVGRWLLDEPDGPVVRDTSDKGNDGKAIKVTRGLDGPFPGTKATEFDGRGAYTLHGHEPFDFGVHDAFSCTAWIKPNILLGYRSIMSKVKGCMLPNYEPHISSFKCPFVPGDWDGITFFVDERKQDYRYIRIQFGDMEGPRRVDVTTRHPVLRLNEWQHVAFTYDGSGSAYGVKFFVNGQEVEPTVHFDCAFWVDFRLRQASRFVVNRAAAIVAFAAFAHALLGIVAALVAGALFT